jgi:hypothetical protein
MGTRCRRSDIWARTRRFRVNHTDCGRSAETQLHADTNDHVGRGRNRGYQLGDIPSVRQGKQRQRPGADGVGLPLRWLRVPRLSGLPWLPLRWLRVPGLRVRRLRPLRRLRLATCLAESPRADRDVDRLCQRHRLNRGRWLWRARVRLVGDASRVDCGRNLPEQLYLFCPQSRMLNW